MSNINELSFPELEKYIGYMQAIRGRSPLTVKEYRYDLIMFFRFIKRERKLVDKDQPFNDILISDVDSSFIRSITLDDMYSFVTYLSVERKSSSATRSRKIASLKSFFHYLKSKQRIIDEDPTAELESPKQSRKLPRYLTLEESKNLLSAAADIQEDQYQRDYCILTMFLNCGMRLSELVNVNIRDINEDTLKVTGKGSKERTIYLNSACISALSDWLTIRHNIRMVRDKDALFVSRQKRRISNKQVQLIVKKYMRNAGIDTSRYSVHKLRHTAATLMYKYGKVDIRSLQQILGHESISTTEIYTHTDSDQLHTAVESNPLAGIRK
ncbi:MAG: tyrosine recombinase XerC [Eubacteriales bacterium]|nr:tyrosine recombinase XerC [Eubacteriales bacterium]